MLVKDFGKQRFFLEGQRKDFLVEQQQKLFFQPSNPQFSKISGLAYQEEFLDREVHDRILKFIDKQPWENSLKRKVQQYGYRYDYRKQTIDRCDHLGQLPSWLDHIAESLVTRGLSIKKADQVIVNEYLPGQGIAPHIDRASCFGETIAIISLGSHVLMDFTHPTTNEKISHLLAPFSLLFLTGSARHDWKHGIAARKSDRFDGKAYLRERRVSLTFREVIDKS